MKRLISIILCVSVMLLTTACGSTQKDLTTQYCEIINKYENQHGTITTGRKTYCPNDALGGVSYLELIDFDANGTDELLIIFDQNSPEVDLGGALTCHIYADLDGTATRVYECNLAITDIRTAVSNTIGCDFTGRTLCFTEDGSKTGLLQVRMYTQEMEYYPLKIYDTEKAEPITTYNHSFLEYQYLSFNGTDFVTDRAVAVEKGSPSSNLFLLDGSVCSEYTFNESKIPVARYVEPASLNFDKCLEGIDSVKTALGIEKTTPSAYTPNVIAPRLKSEQITEKYTRLLKNYEEKYTVAYSEHIDFNNDGFNELLMVYPTNNVSKFHYSPEKYVYVCQVFGVQGEELVSLISFNLPVNDYRSLNGKTLWIAQLNGKTCLYSFMNYTLHMPEEGLSDFINVDDNYHQFFTSDCYYSYNGEGFVLEGKYSWQGERDEMITMINDKRCTHEEFHKYQESLDTIIRKIDITPDNDASTITTEKPE
ncbi:MAG: hypothetical protein IKV44_03605 [Clostridia bacterium]|nr:hypothetical protein [Clostridia bacterium]